jgi:hypothetical protein
MYVVFVDESGYQQNWAEEASIKQQPVYVLSAVAIHSGDVQQVYETIRNGLNQLNLGIDVQYLGRGKEIKANDVDKGGGFWGNNPSLRDQVRQIYLNQQATTYFVVCIDKARHRDKYAFPEDPTLLGLRFLFERIQGFLNEKEQPGFVLIDYNKPLEPELREHSSQLLIEGSGGIAASRFYESTYYTWYLKMLNVIEIHFGDSKYSLGLQIADFLARHTYSWWKSGKGQGYPGWNYIEPKLYRYPCHHGWGYKEFPEESP